MRDVIKPPPTSSRRLSPNGRSRGVLPADTLAATTPELEPDVIARWDSDLRCRYINRAIEKKTGRPVAWFLGKTNAEAGQPPEVCQLWDEHLRRVFQTGEELAVESVFPTPHGPRSFESTLAPEFASDGSGRVEFVFVIMRDVTRLKRAEQAFRDSEARFHAFMDYNPLLAFIKDSRGRYLYVNSAFEEFFGIKFPALRGKTDSDWLPPEVARQLSVNDSALLASSGVAQFEEVLPAPDGSQHHFLVYKFLVRGGETQQQLLCGLAVNITERWKAEQTLAEARDAAIENAKLKGAFLANMSHEIRTPLNGMIGMTELLLDTALTDEQRETTRVIHSSGEVLLGVVNDILDLSKIEAGMLRFEQRRFDLRGLVDDTVNLLAARARQKGLKLKTSVAREIPPTLRGDPARLRQVLTNLVGNALKFTEQGTIEITVSCQVQDREGTTLYFEVRDTGIGISPEGQKRLFEAFSQADNSTTRRYGGTGLGLSISKELVTRMGGTIGVESREGHGSTFWFLARFAKDAPDDATELAKSENPVMALPPLVVHERPRLRVLLVEDNVVNQRVAVHQLQRLGCTIETATNGQEALEKFARGRFDVILMDCHMPVMDGYAATAAIRQREGQMKIGGDPRPRIRIIALTASVLEADREKCLAAGMDDYLSKPFKRGQLEAMLFAQRQD